MNVKTELEMYGVVERRGVVPSDLIDRYVEFWHKQWVFDESYRPPEERDRLYLQHKEIRNVLLCDGISELFEELDLCLALHTDITYWRSPDTGWHFDSLDDNPNALGQYMGVWVALDDVDPDAGPFQYVPGSHRWNPTGEITRESMAEECRRMMADEEHEVVTFLPKKGDVLMWNSKVIHRASPPTVGRPRKGLLGHFANQWSWSGAGVPPPRSEVAEVMRWDQTIRSHRKGWFKVPEGWGEIDYDTMLLSYTESGNMLT
jgi:hypothetical protein